MQFCVVFPDADYYVWREVEFHAQAKIDSNQTAGVSAVPTGWIIQEQGSTTIASGSSQKTVAHTLGVRPVKVELFLSAEATTDGVVASSTDTNTNITITLERPGGVSPKAVEVSFTVNRQAP